MTLKVAVWPTATVWLAGCVVMDGAIGVTGAAAALPPEHAVNPAISEINTNRPKARTSASMGLVYTFWDSLCPLPQRRTAKLEHVRGRSECIEERSLSLRSQG